MKKEEEIKNRVDPIYIKNKVSFFLRYKYTYE